MQTGETLIEVKDLCKHFRDGTVKALDGVDLTIRKGDVIVIIGPSGSGKSTFLRSLNLLETPTSGSVIVEGTDITKKKNAQGKKIDLDAHRRKMTRCPDIFSPAHRRHPGTLPRCRRTTPAVCAAPAPRR